MLDLAKICCDMNGCSYDNIKVVEPPQKKTMIKRLSTKKIRSYGWKPTVELNDGMKIVNEWVKQYKWID
jgi:nucleoside-diphosphate-sugar epimerase